ncbi:MAG: uroporphyrinogen decarboxylase [Deltaproteobacteria bacterium]|nr:uroporphyrinogen decarboxylase [Deltaproteobacteria bacterium]
MARAERFLQACRGEQVDAPPVWLMRQAGRYLPEYQKVRARTDFLGLCKTPEWAAEVTLQPVDILGVDAAIIFSDILIPVEAMGMKLVFDDHGPGFPDPIRDEKAVDALTIPDPQDRTGFVLEAIRLTVKALGGRVPLIGFAGAPYTLLSYMVEGGSSRNFENTKRMMYTRPDLVHRALEKITETQLRYLRAQVAAGARAIQVFDSWGGHLAPDDFREFAAPYARRILDGMKDAGVPRIYFVLDGGTQLPEIQRCGADVVGLDWRTPLGWARSVLGERQAVQGNLDPCALLGSQDTLRRKVKGLLDDNAGRPGHVVNLGHGILPMTPPEHARAFVEMVHELGARP